MEKKVTWNTVYRDFKKHFPRMSKEVLNYDPCDYMTIKIYLKQGRALTYNMKTGEAKPIRGF